LDYLPPSELLNEVVRAASRKVSLSVRDLLIGSFLAGGLLSYVTSLVFIVLSQNIDMLGEPTSPSPSIS
jgi:formate/nitrite transporter FocA (FNT family)